MKRIFTFKKLLLLIVISSINNTYAQQWWNAVSSQNTAICTAGTLQANVQTTKDKSGGAIMVWEDSRNAKVNLFAQRISTDGTIQWATNGIRISTSDSTQSSHKIIDDGNGGAFIAWVETGVSNTTDIYSQHLDSNGNATWASRGVAICNATNNQFEISMAKDTSGGFYIAWTDSRTAVTTSFDIYIQRVNANGTVAFTANGNQMTIGTKAEQSANIIVDGNGDVLVSYIAYMGNSIAGNDIIVAKVTKAGNRVWATDVSNQGGNEEHQRIATDNLGGAYIVWDLGTSTASGYNIYAQRINGSGAVQWAAGGITVCGVNGVQINPEIVADGFGNAIMAWSDNRHGLYPFLYAQKYNNLGIAKWTGNGKTVAPTPTNSQENFSIFTSSNGASVYAIQDVRNAATNGGYYDIYAQQLDSLGNAIWGATGVVVSNAANSQNLPKIIASDNGSYIVTWEDLRNGASDIYASKINAAGTLPTKITQFNARKKETTVQLNWTSENEMNVSHFNIQRSNDGKNFEVIGAVNAGKNEYSFSDVLLNNSSQIIYYRLQIVDKDGSVYYSKIVTVSNNTTGTIKVYPTIVTGQVNVEFTSKSNEIVSIKVFDVSGKIVDVKYLDVVAGKNNFHYDCSRLNAGNYFMSFIINNQLLKTENLIKQ